jgi:hypothetical protein
MRPILSPKTTHPYAEARHPNRRQFVQAVAAGILGMSTAASTLRSNLVRDE